MISFRLSAEEYEKFRELCFSSGIRSVSEMARVAINTLLQEPRRVSSESLEARVAELEGLSVPLPHAQTIDEPFPA